MGRRLSFCIAGTQLGQRDGFKKVMNVVGQVFPQVMGQAASAIMTVARTTAPRSVHGLVHRRNHTRDRNLVRRPRQPVTAARPARALDQPVTPQACEQLLKISGRDTIAPRDVGQRNGSGAVVQCKIQHGGDRITAAGGELHGCPTRFISSGGTSDSCTSGSKSGTVIFGTSS